MWREVGRHSFATQPAMQADHLISGQGVLRMESVMKRLWMTGIAVTALMAGASVMAQDATLTIQPEQRTIIRDYVVKERVQPVQVQENVAIGAAIPDQVELRPVPVEIYGHIPDTRPFEYFDWNGRIVFVDPQTRRVVQIVD
jgi:hypothetical protein